MFLGLVQLGGLGRLGMLRKSVTADEFGTAFSCMYLYMYARLGLAWCTCRYVLLKQDDHILEDPF